MKYFLESKNDASKCQLFLALLKSHSLAVVRRLLSIKIVRNLDTSNHVVRNIQSFYKTIGKYTHSKDHNVASRVLLESIVTKCTRQCHLLTCTCNMFKVSRKTLHKYSHVREKLDSLGQIDCWAFIGRVPHSNMKLIDAVKELVQKFWPENTNIQSKRCVKVKKRF